MVLLKNLHNQVVSHATNLSLNELRHFFQGREAWMDSQEEASIKVSVAINLFETSTGFNTFPDPSPIIIENKECILLMVDVFKALEEQDKSGTKFCSILKEALEKKIPSEKTVQFIEYIMRVIDYNNEISKDSGNGCYHIKEEQVN